MGSMTFNSHNDSLFKLFRTESKNLLPILKFGICAPQLKLDHHFKFTGSNGSNHFEPSLELFSLIVAS
jgi:hypothetical protein